MKIESMSVGYMNNRCYIVSDEKTQNCVLIDAPFCEEDFIERIGCLKGKLKYILLTHRHYDHLSAAKKVAQITGAKIAIFEKDVCGLIDSEFSLGKRMGIDHEPVEPDVVLHDGDEIRCDSLKFKVLNTPGHTIGSVCFIIENAIFSGDTLFCRSVGRTDFPTGSYTSLMESLKKLYDLPGDYRIYPGHSEPTVLSDEIKHNQFFREALNR